MSELWRLSAVDLAGTIKSGQASAREATESALKRLAEANPAVNAVVHEMPDEALASADAIDADLAKGDPVGPLAGVPVTVKVNVDQKGYATTNGLRIQKDLIAEEDNPVVANMRKAGAIIIGRTNTPAFSLHWFTRNSLHGHTLNPHNPTLTPGGSSGGAAAATAVGIGTIGHGTDIAGSVRYPAYACGIHGLRPTLGRIPAVNFSAPDRLIGGQIMAVSGPLARTIDDVRLGLEVMSAGDPREAWWAPVPLDLPEQPRKVAMCVAPEGLEVQPEVEQAVREAGQQLADAGWHVEEKASPPFREAARLQAMLWLAEHRRSAGHAIEEEDDPDAKFVYAQMVRHCPETDLNGFLDALQRRATILREWQMFFEDTPVLLCPVSAELPFPDLLDLESPEAFDRVFEALLPQIGTPFLGLPGLTVATGLAEGNVPKGVQLITGRYREDTALAAGRAIEEASGVRAAIDPAPAP
ncbi:MAG: amidase family protein [Pseudomonadota bacterium]